ncbi:hypothetical protein LARI1_G009128 [Lachnellula arida]|uniref:NAD(P)-binding domain-containing protein n=1 Tax=Lachnellula arida TaxID=1316785 RepID=A0A8T9B2G4_9HELO|nr:hypothetical protein LARI1_G009128 [Lachnellula arida]
MNFTHTRRRLEGLGILRIVVLHVYNLNRCILLQVPTVLLAGCGQVAKTMAKIFFVGATGHIGGAVLDLISSSYSDTLSVRVLVRDQQKADQLVAQYQYIVSVIGNLDSLELLEAESRDAYIVISAGPDVTHNAGIRAILKGLGGRSNKGYYIHTSGAALIWDKPDGSKPGTRIWDDVADIKTLTSMPEGAYHRAEDKAVFEASSEVNVAIISPCVVYGLSPSRVHPLPLSLPLIMKPIRALSSGFSISSGKNIQSYIHVVDVARMYLLLLSHALQQSQASAETKPETHIWGPEAYYFAEQEELSFKEFMELVLLALQKHGQLAGSEIKEIDVGEVAEAMGIANGLPEPDSWAMHVAIMFGTNMRVRSSRARALGWKPQDAGVAQTLDEVLRRYLEAEEGG